MKKHNLNKIKKGILISTLAVGLVGCAQQAGGGNKCQAVLCVNYDQVIEEGHHHLCKKDNCLVRSDFEGDIHVHDFCNEQECANIKVTDENHKHFDKWFKVETIGGEGSAYKVAYPDWDEYCDTLPGNAVSGNTEDTIDMMNKFQDNYKKYIEELTFSDKFTAYCEKNGYQTPADIEFKKFTEYGEGLLTGTTVNCDENNFDYLIGATDDEYKKSINDICAPIFEDIIKNVRVSNFSNLDDTLNATLDKSRFINYYDAIRNEVYKNSYGAKFTDTKKLIYTETKTSIKNNIGRLNVNCSTKFSIYKNEVTQNGEAVEIIDPDVVQQMDLMLDNAATNMGVEKTDLQNIINLSYVMDSLKTAHNLTSSYSEHSNYCSYPENIMSNKMDEINVSEMKPLTSNTIASINPQNQDHELC